MAVKYYTDSTDYKLPAKGRTAVWLGECTANEGFRLGAVNYIFCSSERHLALNREFLGHDYFTDVITFDYSDLGGRGVVSGDVFVDPATVADNALQLGTDPVVEMRRVLVHGLLHLCGYGDKTPDQQRVMRSKEDFYLTRFSVI
ncbi:MAG: rRNA maturation RNase YbeY [Rikenellaceae bacterium]|jgi:rRNA maturation RNase YbeY|nr:rRNA maturation RNase YbeY [Rikenellaceae bacterium]